jgi:hypothetical protein
MIHGLFHHLITPKLDRFGRKLRINASQSAPYPHILGRGREHRLDPFTKPQASAARWATLLVLSLIDASAGGDRPFCLSRSTQTQGKFFYCPAQRLGY